MRQDIAPINSQLTTMQTRRR